MSLFLCGPGVAFGLGGGKILLGAPLAGAAVASPTEPATPASVSGLSGWWDAGAASGLLAPNGAPLSSLAAGTAVASLTDKSGANNAMVPTSQVQAAPRINGLLGGAGLPTTPPVGQGVAPQLSTAIGYQVSGLSMGSGQGWTRYLVWTRPNLPAGTTAPVALLTIGSTVVLALDSTIGGRLVLFPGASQTVLSVSMTRRHTHNVILRYTVSEGVDAWLDGVQVATAAPNPLPSVNAGTLTFLSGAACWFNEAATWERALSSTDVGTLITATPRWTCGARRGVNVLVIGQSNAAYSLSDGAWNLLAQGLAWHLGAASYGVIGGSGGSAYTAVGGHGIYDVPAQGLPGSFIADPGDGSNPSGWALGADGAAVQSYLSAQAADDVADIVAIVWPWSETDSTRAYSEENYFQGGAQNFLAKARAMLDVAAAGLPLVWWNAMPFWTSPGAQMHREVVAAMVAASAQNVVCGMPMTADSNPRGSTWSATTGQILAAGDNDHLDATDNLRLGMSAAGPAARGVLASSGGDTITAIPSGVPSVGPHITHAYRQSNTVIIVTVAHNAGTDLVVPLQAANGVGWAVMDGGSNALPGTIRTATACARVDATHLQITLGSALTSASAGCSLFYPYGNTWIYRGNAVTDNSATVARPAGWDIGADLGSSWDFNLPLQATTTPIILSDSST
jgi:hypothetical protein